MTRFEQELSGKLGTYWKNSAEKELEAIKKDLEEGKITIDENGVARNCIGRVLMNDMLERLTYVTDEVNVEATRSARDEEVSNALNEYRRNAKPTSKEQIEEMRNAFGTGNTIVNVITGERIYL